MVSFDAAGNGAPADAVASPSRKFLFFDSGDNISGTTDIAADAGDWTTHKRVSYRHPSRGAVTVVTMPLRVAFRQRRLDALARDLALAAGRRGSIECRFEAAKRETGLDEYEVRRLPPRVAWPVPHDAERALLCSHWRRRHQARARKCRCINGNR